ncbi:hypothetical protein SAMN05421813_10522 [Daejeonella rubra]|uniref:Uncharacterized protein n=1 Tax=Daejeonella rubra TaxID=990371 RepID=A0A1G9PX55_9SPHI|nr:hypothetical protein SAMN05421813_10522 [Daejeonella rubra]
MELDIEKNQDSQSTSGSLTQETELSFLEQLRAMPYDRSRIGQINIYNVSATPKFGTKITSTGEDK